MNWPTIEAGELMARRNGSVNPANYPEEIFELHSIPAFDAGKPEVTLGKNIGSSKQIIQPNDVMISKIVPHIRRASVVGKASNYRQIASGEWIVFRSPLIHPDFLRHFLVCDQFNAQFMATVSGVGGSLLRARPAEVAKIKIPLPSITEQRRIAAILDKAGALRSKRREAIAKLDQLLQSVFLEMFGDPVTNSKNWPRKKLSDYLNSIDSGKSPVCLDRPAMDDEWGVLKLGAVTQCEFIETQSKALPEDISPDFRNEVNPGDLLFSRKNTRELVAACVLVRNTRTKLLLPDLIFRLNLKPEALLSKEYLHSLLINPGKRLGIQSLAGGAAGSMPNISKAKLLDILIEMLPFELQQSYAAFRNKIEKIKSNTALMLERHERLVGSLQAQFFTH